MTIEEFSNEFDILASSYKRFKDFDRAEILDSIEFSEYEKSVFLTKAQLSLVINLYNGKNPFGDSFENSEETRRYLEELYKTVELSPSISDSINISKGSYIFKLPNDLAFLTLEQVKFSDENLGCANGTYGNVYPITQDEYSRVKDNPFRGPTRYKVLRLDCGENKVEIISKYNISTYIIRYLAKPKPIILENLPEGLTIDNEGKRSECKLNSVLHSTILENAVRMALSTKYTSSTKTKEESDK